MSTPPPPSTVGTDSLLKLLIVLTNSVERELNGSLRAELDDSLRPAHYAVFRHLDPAGSRIGDLAEAASMTQQSMGELVTHLERCGYVERSVDPSDRRARLVVTTAAGKAALASAAEHLGAIENRIAAQVGVEQLALLRDLLARASAAVTDDVA